MGTGSRCFMCLTGDDDSVAQDQPEVGIAPNPQASVTNTAKVWLGSRGIIGMDAPRTPGLHHGPIDPTHGTAILGCRLLILKGKPWRLKIPPPAKL